MIVIYPHSGCHYAISVGCVWLCSCSGCGHSPTNLLAVLPLRHLEHGSSMYINNQLGTELYFTEVSFI